MPQSRTAAFDASIKSTHPGFVVSVQVLDALGNVATTLHPEPGGAVSFDRTRKARRSLAVTVEDPTGALVPSVASDTLAPSAGNGHLIRVRRGVDYAAAAVKDAVSGAGFGSTGTLQTAIAGAGGLTLP